MKLQGWTISLAPIAVLALSLLLPYAPSDFATQIIINQDSTKVIVNGDTTTHITTFDDFTQVFRSKVLYDNGYRMHIWEYKTVDLLTGVETPEILLSINPFVGTQVNWYTRAGKNEVATEKVPECLNTLPVEKANAIGWYSSVDTSVITDTLGKISSIVTEQVWSKNSKRIPLRIVKNIGGE